jgi:hypothetical protein
MKRRIISALAAGTVALSGTAFAQSFTPEDVEAFIVVTDELEGLQDKYPDDELEAAMPDGPEGLGDLIGEDGKLAVFSTLMNRLEGVDAPPARDVRAAIARSRFETMPVFGEKADAIMMAYAALNLEAEGASMEAVDPAMLDMMPPEMRAQMAPMLALVEAMRSVPPADIEAIKPYKDRLDAAMQD